MYILGTVTDISQKLIKGMIRFICSVTESHQLQISISNDQTTVISWDLKKKLCVLYRRKLVFVMGKHFTFNKGEHAKFLQELRSSFSTF